jgi:chromosome segregation ATPase
MPNASAALIQKLLAIPKIAELISAPLRSELERGAGDTESLSKLLTELEHSILPQLKAEGKSLSGKIRHDLNELETAVAELKKSVNSVKTHAKNINDDLAQIDTEIKTLTF